MTAPARSKRAMRRAAWAKALAPGEAQVLKNMTRDWIERVHDASLQAETGRQFRHLLGWEAELADIHLDLQEIWS